LTFELVGGECTGLEARLRFVAHLRDIVACGGVDPEQPKTSAYRKSLPSRTRHHDPTHFESEIYHGARVRFAFDLIAVEQRERCLAADDSGCLPREIVGVADAAVHALAREGRCQMRRIAEEVDTTLAPAPRQPGMKRVDALAAQLAVSIRAMIGKQVADEFFPRDLIVPFVLFQHELVAPDAVGPGQRDAGARRIAVNFCMAEPVQCFKDIDNQPAFGKGGAVQFDAERLAGRRPRAIGRGHQLADDGQQTSFWLEDLGFDACAIVDKPLHRVAEHDPHMGKTKQTATQDGLQFRLLEGVAFFEAVIPGGWIDGCETVAPGVEIARAIPLGDHRLDLGRQSGRLDRAHGFIVDRDGARLIDRGRVAFDDNDIDAGLPQKIGE